MKWVEIFGIVIGISAGFEVLAHYAGKPTAYVVAAALIVAGVATLYALRDRP